MWFEEEDNHSTRNCRSTLEPDGTILTAPVGEQELIRLRDEIVRTKPEIALRSCWECNPSHRHFLEGEWGSWVFRCFSCGRVYFRGVDVSVYETQEEG